MAIFISSIIAGCIMLLSIVSAIRKRNGWILPMCVLFSAVAWILCYAISTGVVGFVRWLLDIGFIGG